MIVFAYGRNVDIWWSGIRNKLTRARNLKIYALPAAATQVLAGLAERSMTLHVNVQDATAWVSSAKGEAGVDIKALN